MMVHIAPELPDALGGVADYASLLLSAIALDRTPSAALTVRGGRSGQERMRRCADHLVERLEDLGAQHVLLHYSGYGYAKRGLCFWLSEGLSRWRKGNPHRRLLLIAHELYATGWPWRSSFFTALPQRAIARKLVHTADAAILTSAATAAAVRRWRPSLTPLVLPVFSNIGAPDALPAWEERAPHAVVFGGPARRTKVYDALARRPDVAHRLVSDASRILDIGPPGPRIPAQIGGCPVDVLGPLPAEAASAHLKGARYGLLAYRHHVLTKSGIFAAYTAHGLAAINLGSGTGLSHGLQAGREFLTADTFAAAHIPPQETAAAGRLWYQNHTLGRTAQSVRSLLAGMA